MGRRVTYERFWEAIEGYEEAYERFEPSKYRSDEALEQVRRNAEVLFEALFEHIPRGEVTLGAPAGIAVGRPDPPPSTNMLDRLKELNLPDTNYKPDERDPDELIIAVHIKASILFTTWLLSGYGDDVQPTHDELSQLIRRFRPRWDVDDKDSVHQICSLSFRVAAELALQRRDHVEALANAAESVFCLNAFNPYSEGSCPPIAAPWLSDIRERSKTCIEAIEQPTSRGIDWSEIIESCDRLGWCFSNQYDGSEHDYWIAKRGWAEAQLTPDQLRTLYEGREDESAERRLQTYFFSDDYWRMLPERAREALVTADRVMVSSTLGRRAGILNEIRIATEEVLHRYLWIPLFEWAAAQRSLHPGVKEVLGKPEQSRRSPSIDDYVQLLWHSGAKDYFQSLGLSDDDVRFLTRENRTTKHLQTLQRTRNTAEHEPGSVISPSEVRDLYAESLGIGRKGILPELLRLLAPGRRGAG